MLHRHSELSGRQFVHAPPSTVHQERRHGLRPRILRLKCQSTVTKDAAKLTLAVSICHVKMADAGVKLKPFDEEACATAARGKYDAANAKLTCPSFLNSAAVGDNVGKPTGRGRQWRPLL